MSARAFDPHGSSPDSAPAPTAGPRAEGSARVLPVGVDSYMRSCAEFLASRLASCSGTSTPDNFDGVESFAEGKIASDYPDWYSELTSGDGKYSGDLLRDALVCMARGETPRLSQREARYLVDRINAARAAGDRGMDLPPQYKHGGGARAGVKQARLRVARRTSRSPRAEGCARRRVRGSSPECGEVEPHAEVLEAIEGNAGMRVRDVVAQLRAANANDEIPF